MNNLSGLHESMPTALRNFDTYVGNTLYPEDRRREVQDLQVRLHELSHFIRRLPLVNQALVDFGQDDLVITERAPMMPIPSPEYVLDAHLGNSFARKLMIPPHPNGTPAGPVDISQICNGTYERPDIIGGHFDKPVFARALIISPDIVEPTVLRASDVKSNEEFLDFVEEIQAVNWIFSGVVDAKDRYVTVAGKVNQNYLIT